MKFNDDQIKEFAKAYFDQQLQKLPAEFRPVNKIRLEGLAANGSVYVSPESVFESIDSKCYHRFKNPPKSPFKIQPCLAQGTAVHFGLIEKPDRVNFPQKSRHG